MNSQAILSEIWVYPVKSFAGVSLRQSLLTETGLEWDRCWMVVDAQGHMVSQRDIPTMALITPRFRAGDVVLRAPGMLALDLALDQAEGPTQVEVWGDTLPAYDMGDLAAQWVTDFLSQTTAGKAVGPLRLARFEPEHQRQIADAGAGEQPDIVDQPLRLEEFLVRAAGQQRQHLGAGAHVEAKSEQQQQAPADQCP